MFFQIWSSCKHSLGHPWRTYTTHTVIKHSYLCLYNTLLCMYVEYIIHCCYHNSHTFLIYFFKFHIDIGPFLSPFFNAFCFISFFYVISQFHFSFCTLLVLFNYLTKRWLKKSLKNVSWFSFFFILVVFYKKEEIPALDHNCTFHSSIVSCPKSRIPFSCPIFSRVLLYHRDGHDMPSSNSRPRQLRAKCPFHEAPKYF